MSPIEAARHDASATSSIRKILCATDFSACSHAAFDAAVDLARTCQAELELLHVYQAPLGGLPSAVLATTIELVAGAAVDRLAEWRRRALAAGITVVETVCIPADRIVDAIVARGREDSADLLVLGTHGRTGLEKLWLGSVAEQVLRRAPCPVLVVRHR